MARPGRFELPAFCSAGKRSIRAELRAQAESSEQAARLYHEPRRGSSQSACRERSVREEAAEPAEEREFAFGAAFDRFGSLDEDLVYAARTPRAGP